MFDAVLDSHFTDEGVDWINWFIFENEWGQKDWSLVPTFDSVTGKMEDNTDPMRKYGAKDEKGEPICHSFESTYEFVKQYLKYKTNE